MIFLDEASAPIEIARIIAATDQAQVAVAFWGAGAVQRLGLCRPGLTLTVLCNLDSGACNPSEIRTLLDAGVDVRSNPRLHGKVYWTPSAVVLGSSNASTNGLAVEGAPLSGWAEANVLLTDPQFLADTRDWCARQWTAGYSVTPEVLSLAEDLWKARARRASAGLRLGSDLIEAFHGAPNHPSWNRLKVVIWSENLSPTGAKELRRFHESETAFSGYDAYEDWHNEFVAGDWIIDIDSSGHRPSLTGYWQVPDPKLDTPLLTYVRPAQKIRLPAFPALTIGEQDRTRLLGAVRKLIPASESGVVLPFATVMRAVFGYGLVVVVEPLERPSEAKIQAFEAAMRDLCARVFAIGYKANDFRTLIDTRGGGQAAQHLLRPGPPSHGLTELHLRGRADLSVEALVQRPEWRELFTTEELRTAAKRYSSP